MLESVNTPLTNFKKIYQNLLSFLMFWSKGSTPHALTPALLDISTTATKDPTPLWRSCLSQEWYISACIHYPISKLEKKSGTTMGCWICHGDRYRYVPFLSNLYLILRHIGCPSSPSLSVRSDRYIPLIRMVLIIIGQCYY